MTGQRKARSLDWQEVFPYEPYTQQRRGITATIETLSKQGVHLLEGPCGTGKTLIALTAGLSLVADPETGYERLLVVTSKKQQIRAFEDDLEAINQNLDGHRFEGLSLVGKADVCPYVSTGEIDASKIYHRCAELKEGTDRLMREASAEGRVEKKAHAAVELSRIAETQSSSDQLTTAGTTAPYESSIPSYEGEEYCPFFASHFANQDQGKTGFDVEAGMRSRETLANGTRSGTCPHMAMKQVAMDGDVLIGNYSHAFNPLTVEGFTGRFLNEKTLLIVDEAHELVTHVRDELSYSVGLDTMGYAIGDSRKVLGWLEGEGRRPESSLALAMEERGSFETNQIRALRHFLHDVRSLFAERVESVLEAEYGSEWQSRIADVDTLEEHTIPLQTDEGEWTDVLERWVEANASTEDWVQALYLTYAVGSIRTAVEKRINNRIPDGDFAVEKVRELLHRWLLGNHTEFYRELVLTPRAVGNENPPSHSPWAAGFRAEVKIHNCIPEREIAATIDAFGGAILQSATLEPMDVFGAVTGADLLETGDHPDSSLVTKAAARYQDSAAADSDSLDSRPASDVSRKRTVETSAFEVTFPESNRLSLAVDVPKFTYSNRWPPAQSTDVRDQYATAIEAVATSTPGNVLVFMPSYQEATWAANMLDDRSSVEKPVLCDQSSSDAATERLKREFVAGEPKVLTTSLLGTLVEGVDFAGDKLHGAVVCGVPIAHTGSKLASAIERAYAYRFGGANGFEYAFTVPAVRKVRQAIGRVIRGTDDVGVRVLVDERYAHSDGFSDVRQHFPVHVQDEFEPTALDELTEKLYAFWE